MRRDVRAADEVTIEVAVRRARMDAARTSSTLIAAMAAGAGADLVARQQLAREVLSMRLQRVGHDPERFAGRRT